MSYSRHLSMDEIEKIWTSEKDNEFGTWIGVDLLISGKNIENAYNGITSEDIESECGEFSENGYYLIINADDRNYLVIYEISDSEDLALRYYYND